jgi:hypothetical protein
MTDAREAAIHHEIIKVDCRQAKGGGWLITIRTHRDDMNNDLVLAPKGQRFAGAFVPLKDAEWNVRGSAVASKAKHGRGVAGGAKRAARSSSPAKLSTITISLRPSAGGAWEKIAAYSADRATAAKLMAEMCLQSPNQIASAHVTLASNGKAGSHVRKTSRSRKRSAARLWDDEGTNERLTNMQNHSGTPQRKLIYAWEDDIAAMRSEIERMRAALTRGMASDMNNVLKDKTVKELLEKTENIARKASVIRVYNSSDTFGGNVPPHKPKSKCPHCGKTLPQD